MAKHTIPEAAELMKYTPAYVRALIRKGDLESPLEPLVPESLVMRHMISDEAIAAFFGGVRRKTHRADGRNKWLIYMNPTECETVKVLLKANGLEGIADTIRTANKVKGLLPKAPVTSSAKGKRRGKTV